MRKAIGHLVNETGQTEKLKGHTDCVLLVFHTHSAENVVTALKHKFEDIIKTQLHANMHEGKCMELFLLEGPAERVKEMARAFQSSKKVDYTKLLAI
jgi:CopG family nickel-responsive transcriptional regulator